MEQEAGNLPFLAEYAKTGRASCKKCKNSIEKGILRIAVMVQSRHHDGKDSHWFHTTCFFDKARPQSVGDIAKFETLRWEDQQLITKKISSPSTLSGSKDKVTKANWKDYAVEYAKSGRSSCIACEKPIANKEIRISKLDHTSEIALSVARGGIPRYHHMDCFVDVKEDLGFIGLASNLPGFKTLTLDDQKLLSSKLSKKSKPKTTAEKRKLSEESSPVPTKLPKNETVTDMPSTSKTSTKRASATSASSSSKNTNSDSKTEEENIKKENKKMYAIRDKLNQRITKKQIRKADLVELLLLNKQDSTGGLDLLLDHLADVMVFGALLPCVKCNGQYEYRSGIGYQCTGHISEFTKCLNIIERPPRVNFKMPENLRILIPGYNRAVANRTVPKHAPVAATSTGEHSGFVKINRTPLKGFKFVVSNMLPKIFFTKICKVIAGFEGEVVEKLTSNVAAFVCTLVELKKDTSNIKAARQNTVPVVTVDFINKLSIKKSIVEVIKETLISDWIKADSIAERLKTLNKEFELPEERKKTKEGSKLETKGENIKLQMKGGWVVDPDCEIAEESHIYKKGELAYSVVLKRTDIDSNKNSFYKIQLLEGDNCLNYYIFRSWGRIGTKIGGNNLLMCGSLKEAKDVFNEHYGEKTGGNVFGKEFKMQPGFYLLMDITYEAPPDKTVSTTTSSKLPISVQELICLIFDIGKMREALVEFELDTKKMPLGKISRDQVMKAFNVLSSLLEIIRGEEKTSDRMLVDLSNQFFSLIPHSFGMGTIPKLVSEVMVHDKIEMLLQLLDIELAYQLLQDDHDVDGKTAVDNYYKKLNAMIDPLEMNSMDYDMISKYLENTHAATHSDYKLDIINAFKVNRHGESKRFKTYENFENRRLLWHGSRTTNFVGILSQGLRIAPPEAPVTGYMFGKGLYFADMVSKSANYCYPSRSNTTGLLLLCEVALGKIKQLTEAKESLLHAPKGFNSVQGVGGTHPDPNLFTTLGNGIKVPYGKPVPTGTKSDLMYNEYIVYDAAQVQIRYIIKVDFAYKSRRSH